MRGRRSSILRADPNLTPLLDVVLQLITFFMMLVHFASRIEGATPSVRLPVVPAALPSQELALDQLAVAVDSEGRIHSSSQTLEPRQQDAWWADQASRRREGMRVLGRDVARELPTVVLVRADREAPFRLVREQLETAQKHGFGRFRLIVEKSDEP